MAERVIVASHYAPIELERPRALLVGGEEDRPIACRDDLILDVAHYFRVVEAAGDIGPYRCRTIGYSYDFRHSEGPSVLSFHWHPNSAYQSPHAHMHQYVAPVDLSKVHAPTGRTSLEQVVRLAIDDFGATPLRDDWEAVLAETEDAFNRYREW